jgi:hypothetical protein
MREVSSLWRLISQGNAEAKSTNDIYSFAEKLNVCWFWRLASNDPIVFGHEGHIFQHDKLTFVLVLKPLAYRGREKTLQSRWQGALRARFEVWGERVLAFESTNWEQARLAVQLIEALKCSPEHDHAAPFATRIAFFEPDVGTKMRVYAYTADDPRGAVLKVGADEDDDEIFGLTVIQGRNKVQIMGWILGAEAKQAKWRTETPVGVVYCVPQDQLREDDPRKLLRLPSTEPQ